MSTNLLESLRFKFTVDRLPNVSYFGKGVTIPSISIGVANVPNRYSNIPAQGDHAVFAPIDITFRIDAKMENYNEILKWMTEISFPDNNEQYGNPVRRPNQTHYKSNLSDGTVTLFTSKDNPAFELTFEDMWPSDVSSINIEIDQENVVYAECTVTFQYVKFALQAI
jgi:hypothetical protein